MPLELPNIETLPDYELAYHALHRDIRAIRIITTRNNQRLFRAAWGILRSHSDAEDVVQDAYMKAFTSLEKYTGKSSLSTWLTRIVINSAIDKKRRENKRRSYLLEQDITIIDKHRTPITNEKNTSPESILIRSEISESLKEAVSELPDDYRLVFILRDVEEMSIRETADVLEIKQATVKSRLFRARKILRKNLEPSFKSLFSDSISFAGVDCETMTLRIIDALNNRP